MGGDRLAIGVDLAEHQRLDEAPGGDEKVKILHRVPELEGAQHVAPESDVAGEMAIPDAAFIDTRDCPHRAVVLEGHVKARRAVSKTLDAAVRKCDLEWH